MLADAGERFPFRLGAIDRGSLGKRFNTIRENLSLPFVLHSMKRDARSDLNSSNRKMLDGSRQILLASTPDNFIDKVAAGDFTANLDISPVWPQVTQLELEAWRVTNRMVGFDGSILQLLLPFTLLSIITFLTALKILGCQSMEGYRNNFSLNPICQIVNRHQSYVPLVVGFNSLNFFLSEAVMMIIFDKLPLRPWLLVSAFSMIGAYMCIIFSSSNPRSGSFYSTVYEN